MSAEERVTIAKRSFHDWAFETESPSREAVDGMTRYLADRFGQCNARLKRTIRAALWQEWIRIASAPVAVDLLLWDLASETLPR